MKTMGRYCKAYPVSRLREFSGWSEATENLRKERKEVDGREVEVKRELSDKDYLYLQENFVVTDGIFLDENIIFDKVTPEWIDYCTNILMFKIPEYQTKAQASEGD